MVRVAQSLGGWQLFNLTLLTNYLKEISLRRSLIAEHKSSP